MKFSNIILATFLIFSLNNVAYAKAEITTKNCPAKMQTSAYIAFNETITQSESLGVLYEKRMNKIKALAETENFKNFKIVSQDIRARPLTNSNSGALDVYINVTIDFDLNYKAVTDLNISLKNTEVNVRTYERRSC